MIDVPPILAPHVIETQPAEPVRKRRRGTRRSRGHVAAGLFVGAVIILDDDAATPCRVVAIAPDGTAYCVPIPN